MKKIISFFIKYPIWERLIVIILLIFGFISLQNLKTSFFPEREPRIIRVDLLYPGASPQELEEGAVIKIEDKLKGIAGIERYTSQSRENLAFVSVEVLRNYNVDDVLDDIKNAVNSISAFPVDMEPPLIYKTKFFDFSISFSLSGPVDLKTLKNYARRVEDDLRNMEGISQIKINGYPDEEIAIRVNEHTLRSYNLNITHIANALLAANLDIGAGLIKTDDEEIAIKFRDKQYYARDLEDIVVRASDDGTIIRLGNIADIRDDWAENPERSYINGEPSVIISVEKTLDEDIVAISDMVHAYVKSFNNDNSLVTAHIINDSTKNLKDRIHLLTKNGIIGFLLVLLSLSVFINLRLAFWVALSIPLSFAGMFIVAGWFGLTINVISLFGMIIVVGILVDDGIIVGENIYQHVEKGKKPFRAAIDGTLEVFPSVLAAILTTIVAFMPFFFLDGSMGDNMRDLAFVVILTIAMSLFEASLILPVHLAHSKALRRKENTNRWRKKLEKYLAYIRDKLYGPSLLFAMKNKIITLALLTAIVWITIASMRAGLIKQTYFPVLDPDYINISLVMKPGTREQKTLEVLNRIEKLSMELNEELKAERKDGKDIIQIYRKDISKDGMGPHAGEIQLILLDNEERKIAGYSVISMLRERVGPVPDAEHISYGGAGRWGKPVSISLLSADLQALKEVKDKLKNEMYAMDMLRDVMDNDMTGNREINFRLKEKAYMLGLSRAEIARQIRHAFYGYEVQRIQRGMDEVKIWVKFDDYNRSSLDKLRNMFVRMPDGAEFPLHELADLEVNRYSAVINHLDGKRVIRVDADLKDQNAEVPPLMDMISNDILGEILKDYPQVSIAEDGQKREMMKTGRSAQKIIPLALLGMFVIIIISFRSFSQASLIMILIPLGIIGAVWGHFIFNKPVSIMSYYGLIALMGIIVNDSIVFVNAINRNLRQAIPFSKAIYEAGISRFRPILLTTFTTFFGLAPLIFESSRQAQFLIPMAISVAFGLLFATFLILILLPVLFVFLNKIRVYLFWFWTGSKPAPEEVEPAYMERIKLLKDEYKI
jgi:multidrug efflux pump subunit AcrB